MKIPNDLATRIVRRIGLLKYLDDEQKVRLRYWLKFHKRLNLENPLGFSEKLQWLKLNNRRPEYHKWVDKYEVKSYVASVIGEQYIIPTLGVWSAFDEIDWDSLPDKFVLKTTHGCGGTGVVLCRNKSMFDKDKARKQIEHSLSRDYYEQSAEWPYKGLQKRIIAEELIGEGTDPIRDYKFFCFNGEVKCFKVDFDRKIRHTANYFNPQGELLPFGETECPPDFSRGEVVNKRKDEMIQLAETLSQGQPFLRIDFYEENGRVYFGEITFYPAAGLSSWTSPETDSLLGSWIQLRNMQD